MFYISRLSSALLPNLATAVMQKNKVTNGERIVCVGWIESYLKNEGDRVTLFQLDTGARGLLAKHGRSEELDLVFLAYTNLLRSLGT